MAPVYFDNNEGAVTGNDVRNAPCQLEVILSVLFTLWKWLSFNRHGGVYGPSCWAGSFGSCSGGFFFPSKSQPGAASCEAVSPGGDTVVPNQVQLLGTAGLIPWSPGGCMDSGYCRKDLWFRGSGWSAHGKMTLISIYFFQTLVAMETSFPFSSMLSLFLSTALW